MKSKLKPSSSYSHCCHRNPQLCHLQKVKVKEDNLHSHPKSLFISIGFSSMISLDVNEGRRECKTQSIRTANRKLLPNYFSQFRKINIYGKLLVIERQPSCKLEKKTNGLPLKHFEATMYWGRIESHPPPLYIFLRQLQTTTTLIAYRFLLGTIRWINR